MVGVCERKHLISFLWNNSCIIECSQKTEIYWGWCYANSSLLDYQHFWGLLRVGKPYSFKMRSHIYHVFSQILRYVFWNEYSKSWWPRCYNHMQIFCFTVNAHFFHRSRVRTQITVYRLPISLKSCSQSMKQNNMKLIYQYLTVNESNARFIEKLPVQARYIFFWTHCISLL